MEPIHPAPVRELDDNFTLVSRRSFFGALLGVGCVAAGALLAVPLLRFFLKPLYSARNLSRWSTLGLIDSLPLPGSAPQKMQVTFHKLDGWRVTSTSEPVYIQRAADGSLRVLSAICPHLGCTIRWRSSQDTFFCPCHGSIFSKQGELIKGPALRGMDPLPTRRQDEELLVRFEFFRENTPDRQVIG